MTNELTSFEELSKEFELRFKDRHFPTDPKNLYDASQYLLSLKGKRVRPVLCLMSNELFAPLMDDAFYAAFAVELFHNFTLVHDDIMDNAPLRRGQETVHEKFGTSTALLAGDVMLVKAYEYLNKINPQSLPAVLAIFNDTASKVCEGQQLDMEFEKLDDVTMEAYEEMIALKTSVLLAASLRMGALLGGAGRGNQDHLYEFGKNIGIAFQVQDDYLDAFGDPKKFGKKTGGDIMANKKTFLLLKALNAASPDLRRQLEVEMLRKDDKKVEPILQIYKACHVDEWAKELKKKYFDIAMLHLDEVAVISHRKEPLKQFSLSLMERAN